MVVSANSGAVQPRRPARQVRHRPQVSVEWTATRSPSSTFHLGPGVAPIFTIRPNGSWPGTIG